MTEPKKERDALMAPGGEQASQDARSESATSGGTATTAPEVGKIERCAVDTITDCDGNYLEPPD
jgi:hypothetical protein